MYHYDLAVRGARQKWTQIRWALFVFPDIVDVEPTDDPGVVRIIYEGTRPYPDVWRVELLQAGFDVPRPEAVNAAVRDLGSARSGSGARGARGALAREPTPLRGLS